MSVKVFIAGDSTAAGHLTYPINENKSDFPRMGWAQVLSDFFTDEVQIINRAHSGRSSKSFRCDWEYKDIFENISSGDYFIIQFGHNDGKPEEERRTDPIGDIFTEGSYKHSLYEYYIKPTLEKGANPIIATSISRNRCSDSGLEPYVNAARELARETGIPCLDLYKRTNGFINDVGEEEAKCIFAHINSHDERFGKDTPLPEAFQKSLGKTTIDEIGDFENSKYLCGGEDNTHLQFYGAQMICQWLCDELAAINHPLAKKRTNHTVSLDDIPSFNYPKMLKPLESRGRA